MGREGTETHKLEQFYLAVIQEILIFGSEMWLETPCIGSALERFHHLVARRITGKHPWK